MVGGIPVIIKVNSSIIHYYEGSQSLFQNFQNSKANQANSKDYIQVNFKDYNLSEFDDVKHLINKCAYDDDLYRLLPFLFRLILEKLLYQLYLTSLDNNQKYLYFSHRPRDFSQLITLFNILKDKEFHQYHGGSINQEIITILKEAQKKGNLTVHQIIRQIDKEYRDNWRDKIDRTLKNLLVLYRNLPENKILIEDIDRLEKTIEMLGINRKDAEKVLINIGKGKVGFNEKNIFTRFYQMISHKIEFTQGELISLVREIGKHNTNKYLDLEFGDSGDMIFLRNELYYNIIYGPGISGFGNFQISLSKTKENNMYKDKPDDLGNQKIYIEFLDYIKQKLDII